MPLLKTISWVLFLAYLCFLPLSIVGMELFFAFHAFLSLGLLVTRQVSLVPVYERGLGKLFWLGIIGGLGYWALVLLNLTPYSYSFSDLLWYSRDVKFFVIFSWALFWGAHFEHEIKKTCFKILPVIVFVVALYGIAQAFFPLDIVAPLRQAGEPLIIQRHFGDHHVLATIGAYNFHLTYGNIYILYFVLCALGTAVLVKQRQNQSKKSFLGLMVIGISLITTFSRNVWINLFVLSLGIGLRYTKRKVLPFLFLLIALGTIFVVVHPLARDFVFKAFDPATDYQGFGLRIRNWQVQWKMFIENPLLGIGHHQNERLYDQYRQRYFPEHAPESHVGGHAHNTFFQILVADGVLGLLIWLGFLGVLWVDFWRHREESPWYGARAGLWLLLAFFISGLTENALGDAEVSHNLFTLLGIAAVFSRPRLVGRPLTNNFEEKTL